MFELIKKKEKKEKVKKPRREYDQLRYKKRKDNNTCFDCGGQRDGRKVRCKECLDKYNNRIREERMRLKEERKCIICKQPKETSRDRCIKCLQEHRDKVRNRRQGLLPE